MKKYLVGIGIFLFAAVLMFATFAAGFVTGKTASLPDWFPVALNPVLQEGSIVVNPIQSGENAGTPGDLTKLFEPFWQTWGLVKEFYVDQPVNEELMVRGAIRGMLESLGDEHTSYLDPQMFETTNAHLQGEEYEGIGAWVDITGEYLTIISPMPGSPAEQADLRPGDKVLAIDGVDMTGLDGEAVRQRVLGPRGSVVVLTIQRDGHLDPMDISVERGAIVVPSVTGEMLDGEIAYVQLFTFGDGTTVELRDTLKDLLDQKPQGLILDLRNNGGGYLNTAIEVVSQFISSGTVMYEEYGDGRQEEFKAESGGLAIDIPMVVLINQGSASASEIVAGAIQDFNRGYLVGETSFGKGSVQTYTELDNKQGAVRITIARWLTPDRRQINGVGLNPNFPVELNETDLVEGKDPQLQKALDVLLKNLVPPPTPIPTLTSVQSQTPTPVPTKVP